MADKVADSTFKTLMFASDLLPHNTPLDLFCETCLNESGDPAKLLVFRCPACSGLLVACDNATCPYALVCVCRLPLPAPEGS